MREYKSLLQLWLDYIIPKIIKEEKEIQVLEAKIAALKGPKTPNAL